MTTEELEALVDRLRYTAAVLDAHKDKFPVPQHIPAKSAACRQAADALTELIRERDAMRAALAAVEATMLRDGAGQIAGYGWNITALNKARPLIGQALQATQPHPGGAA